MNTHPPNQSGFATPLTLAIAKLITPCKVVTCSRCTSLAVKRLESGKYIGYSPWIRLRHSHTPWEFNWRFSCSLSSANVVELIPWHCVLLIQNNSWAAISFVVKARLIFLEGYRKLCMNRETHAKTLMALWKPNLSRTVSKSLLPSTPPAKSSCWTFLSALLLSLGCVTISAGHLDKSANYGGPFHHSFAPVTAPSTAKISWIFDCGYVSPQRVRMTLYLLDPICHKLTVFTLVIQPV